MSTAIFAKPKFFGLLELGADGTVLYSRNETNGGPRCVESVVGRNFFYEVAPFLNVREFQQCVENFIRSSQRANSIAFTCEYDDGPVMVKILMARISEKCAYDVTKSILIHVRKAE
jgi:photoactive yellow protein